MSYIVPSVLVYQQLVNSGGVANVTPDLEACIIGPLNNTLTYVPGSTASQVKTAAMSTTATTGYVASGSYTITVVSTAGFSVGDKVLVIGAGDSGGNLQANLVSISGNVITLDAAATTTITSSIPAVVTKSGSISDASIDNTFTLPGITPGQVIDATSIKPWLNNVRVQTAITGAEGYYTDNTLTIRTNSASGIWSTGSITTGTATLTLSAGGGAGLVAGDTIMVTGAGASGGLLTALITNLVGDVATVTPSAGTTVTGALVTKVVPVNLNSTTNTLRSEPGDPVVYTYTSNSGVSKSVTTAVKTITTSSGLNGTLVSAKVVDSFPADLSYVATGGITSGSTALTVVTQTNKTITAMTWAGSVVTATSTSHGFLVGNVITVSGVTPAGYNGIVIVTGVPTANTFTYALVNNPGAVTAQGVAIYGTNATGMAIGGKVLVSGAGASGADLVAGITGVAGQSITLDTAASTTVAAANVIVVNRTLEVSFRKAYNNQVLPTVKPISGGASFDTSNAGTLGTVKINSGSELVYGPVVSGDVYFGYTALRTDLSNRVLTINNPDDLKGQFGTIDDTNPLALGCQIALANTIGRVRAIAITSNDLTGYLSALSYAEGERLYFLTPMTQDLATIMAFRAHVAQMSTPENASWRVAIVNTAIPTQQYIGQFTPSFVNANGGNNAVTVIAGKYVLTASNATFISDGIAPGDSVYFTASSVGGQVGAHQVLEVISNQQLVIQTTATSTAISYYVSRLMTKTQSAAAVAATSTALMDKRVWHVQPDLVGVSVNGVTKYLPGYYLACGLAGMGAGFPVQQGFTNIGVAGITDLKHSNFYFSKSDLGAMAATGTCLFAQASQGGIPYCRHELTTDVSVLEYRELLVVKNWDFLSYFYHDKLSSFVGSWNIVPDTITTIYQNVTASSELIKAKKLPKIGSPLLSYKILSLKQNAYNKDNLDCQLRVEVVYPLNYLNLTISI